jgi:hypothetical protein
MKWHVYVLLFAISLFSFKAWAQQLILAVSEPANKTVAQDKSNEVKTIKIAITPAAEPKPALKFQLLPGFLDRKSGNAAMMYEKIALQLTSIDADKKAVPSPAGEKSIWEKIPDWLERPLAEFPRDEARETLADFKRILDGLDVAARREECDWQLPIRDGNVINILLPELSHLRSCGRLLALQAKLQISEGRFDQALHTIQTGYALGVHTARGQTLIHKLVGMAICQMMSDRVLELGQQPAAPNLYWALTSLPQPMCDLRSGLEVEFNMLYLYLPSLRQVDDTSRTPEYWQHFIEGFVEQMTALLGTPFSQAGGRATMVAQAIKGYPAARDNLIAQGLVREKVEAMPVAQVMAIDIAQTYNQIRDEMFKWTFVPYWQSLGPLQEVEKKKSKPGINGIISLPNLLLPSLRAIYVNAARSDRAISALRTVEALRLYAAGHQDRLPEKLGDITEVPLPVDPMTGQVFLYKKSGDTAVIESPAPSGSSPQTHGLRYEITIRK